MICLKNSINSSGMLSVTVYFIYLLRPDPVIRAEQVLFVAAIHPKSGKILLLSTDVTLDLLKVIYLYSLRFKIEFSFKIAIYKIETYAYRFWMRDIKPISRGDSDQDISQCDDKYQRQVKKNDEHKNCTYNLD